MSHKKDKHFIPSPFRIVTEYENVFINNWKKNVANAVAEVLKYMAQATAFAIKNNDVQVIIENDIEKDFDDDIEKSKWQIGEIRVNSKGIAHECFEYTKDGKPHLRRVKKQSSGKSVPNNTNKSVTNDITKGKELWKNNSIFKNMTQKECQDFLIKNRIFDKRSNIVNADIESVRAISSAAYNLHQVIPFSPIMIIIGKMKNAIMDASAGQFVRINGKYFTNFSPDRNYNGTHDNYIKVLKKNIDTLKNAIQKYSNNPNVNLSYLQKSIDKYEKKLTKFPCWTYSHKDSVVADIFLHEMGHILNGQCTGGCGSKFTFWYANTRDGNKVKSDIKWNNLRDVVFKKYKKEKRVISEYSTTKAAEFFAECFVGWLHDDPMLPDYVKEFYNGYFKDNKARR